MSSKQTVEFRRKSTFSVVPQAIAILQVLANHSNNFTIDSYITKFEIWNQFSSIYKLVKKKSCAIVMIKQVSISDGWDRMGELYIDIT